MFNINPQSGIIKWIIIFVIALLILSYLGFDLKSTVESQTTQSNFGYVWGYTHAFWDKYLVGPASWIWNNIVIDIVWDKLFLPGLNLIKRDQLVNITTATSSGAVTLPR
ncbi:MAG: hypothetical protein WCJ59_02355 [bacterium]